MFEPGPGFDDLIASLDRQSLGSQRFEVILADDGSGDATRDRLAAVARTRPNVRVLTLPHTGWPGTPRNHGIDAARGEYVFFADQDDRLFDDALQQLCDYADRHTSDVVVGKVVGVGRPTSQRMFRRDIHSAVLGRDPLLELLTPHKLFRSSFLRNNDIRFPDGRVRLEDNLFVMQAYFRAKTISILASTPCYAWVRNKGSASSTRIDPMTYFPHLEKVLEVVEANTAPGELRDTLLRHWYRTKILKRLDGSRVIAYPDDYRAGFLGVVTPIAQKWFGAGVEGGLPFPLRIRSALLRAGRPDELVRLVEFETAVECRVELVSARWTRSGKLQLTLRALFLRDGHDAFTFGTYDASASAGLETGADATPTVWRPPEDLGLDVLPRHVLDAERDLRSDRIELFLRQGSDRAERRIPGRAPRDMTDARVTIDPIHLFARRDPAVGGQLVARARHAGWTFKTPLSANGAVVTSAGRSPVLAGRRCELVRRPDGTLALSREWPGGRYRDFTARAARRLNRLFRKTIPERARAVRARVKRPG